MIGEHSKGDKGEALAFMFTTIKSKEEVERFIKEFENLDREEVIYFVYAIAQWFYRHNDRLRQ